jgi:hypothetical protein
MDSPETKPKIHPSVIRALKFSREDDAKRAADPVAYHLGLIYEYERTHKRVAKEGEPRKKV